MVNTPRQRAVIYARTASRAPQDRCGIERQVTACRRVAAGLDLDIAQVFTDHGVSGLSAQRPALCAR